VLEELSRQTRVLYRDHDDDQHEEYDENLGVTEEDTEHDVEEVIQQHQRRMRESKVAGRSRLGSVVDPLVEMAEEVVDGEADDVFLA